MKISDAGLELIKRFESLRLEAYLPTPDDVPTIGYGHTAGVKLGDTCSPEQALEYLRNDVGAAERCVANSVRVSLTQSQFDALVSFVFNLGCRALGNSTLLRKLNAGDDVGASDEFGKWIHQGSKVLNGLVARREAEKEMFLS